MKRGFTLVELLVVVAIIVVLLALMMPAMDKAIYATELTVCGTRLRGIATGATTYAMDHGRFYPNRSGVGKNWQPQDLVQTNHEAGDDRGKLKPYMSLNGHMNCPLTGKIDIEGSKPTSWLLAPYAFWFGWRFPNGYLGGPTNPGFFKIGQRLGWQDASQGVLKFSVLASDHDLILEGNAWGHGTHPDFMKGSDVVYQDRSLYGVPMGVGSPGNTEATFSRYQWTVDHRRGPIEMNFAYENGSVGRLDQVRWDETDHDDRIARVPFASASASADRTTQWNHLPPE